MTSPVHSLHAAAYHIARYVAERTRIDAAFLQAKRERETKALLPGNDTSQDPDKYAVEERRDETADVWRNTGRGWIWVADFESRQKAEQWVVNRMIAEAERAP